MGLQQPIDPASFAGLERGGRRSRRRAGSETTVQVDGLTPLTDYAVGIRAVGVCGASPTTYQRFETPAIKFKQLSGCFVATAAFGSDLAPEVAALRKGPRPRDLPQHAGRLGRRPLLPLLAPAAAASRDPKPREPSSATRSER